MLGHDELLGEVYHAWVVLMEEIESYIENVSNKFIKKNIWIDYAEDLY